MKQKDKRMELIILNLIHLNNKIFGKNVNNIIKKT